MELGAIEQLPLDFFTFVHAQGGGEGNGDINVQALLLPF